MLSHMLVLTGQLALFRVVCWCSVIRQQRRGCCSPTAAASRRRHGAERKQRCHCQQHSRQKERRTCCTLWQQCVFRVCTGAGTIHATLVATTWSTDSLMQQQMC